MVGESYEIGAKVKAIDAAKRMATLQFADGQTRNVRVRDDVDLSRYTVGDNVVIRAYSTTDALHGGLTHWGRINQVQVPGLNAPHFAPAFPNPFPTPPSPHPPSPPAKQIICWFPARHI
jgi:hypothetical protein